jgi:hypothetical protein
MTVSPSKSFISSDCTAEWTVSFFLVLSRMDSLCPARFPSYPSRIPLLSISPPLHAHLVPLHRSHHSTASPLPLPFLSHTERSTATRICSTLFPSLYIFFQTSLSGRRPSGVVRQVYPFLRFSHRQSVTLGVLAHCLTVVLQQ